jgi:hypothetical protein
MGLLPANSAIKFISPGTGDINYEWHFPSAGVLPIPDIYPVGVIFVRILNQKTSHPSEKYGMTGQLFRGPDSYG